MWSRHIGWSHMGFRQIIIGHMSFRHIRLGPMSFRHIRQGVIDIGPTCMGLLSNTGVQGYQKVLSPLMYFWIFSKMFKIKF